MVAIIRSGKNLKGAVNYNEQKIKEGKAELLMTKGYSKDIDKLKFSDKLNRLQKLADLNTRATTNCLHISLNFDISETLNKDTLKSIAASYTEKIGFGKQPLLVYQHFDAAHQHIHIVTTNIQKDGKRIELHNLGRVQSEKARKEIEISFGLIKASGKKRESLQPLQPIKLEKVMYGKAETKRAISNIVTNVVSQYKFASIPELNAVLQLYNVTADRGAENTRMFEKRGLQYSLLDAKGNKIGKPIKASSIYGKPVLTQLESRYASNKEARQFFKENIKNKISPVLEKERSEKSFADVLKEQGISAVYRLNEQGVLYGITYIDHNTKSVFNGSELGKAYSARAVQEQLQGKSERTGKVLFQTGAKDSTRYAQANELSQQPMNKINLLDIIVEPSKTYHHVPYELKRNVNAKKEIMGYEHRRK